MFNNQTKKISEMKRGEGKYVIVEMHILLSKDKSQYMYRGAKAEVEFAANSSVFKPWLMTSLPKVKAQRKVASLGVKIEVRELKVPSWEAEKWPAKWQPRESWRYLSLRSRTFCIHFANALKFPKFPHQHFFYCVVKFHSDYIHVRVFRTESKSIWLSRKI